MDDGHHQFPFRWLGILTLSLALMAAIAYLDYITGPEISFSVFYLIPISIVAWYLGRRAGIGAAAASTAAWVIADFKWPPDYSHSLVRYWNIAGLFTFYLFTVLLLSGLKRSIERERELSRVDFLTGVNNQRAFHDLAEMEKNRARRYRHPLTLAYLDIDNFKHVNDTLGHPAGDDLLLRVGRALREHLRDTDHVARVGGDEFAILLPETDKDAGQLVLGKLHSALLELGTRTLLPVTFSIGAVTFLGEPESLEQMIREADRLLYAAKNKGKNQIEHQVVDA